MKLKNERYVPINFIRISSFFDTKNKQKRITRNIKQQTELTVICSAIYSMSNECPISKCAYISYFCYQLIGIYHNHLPKMNEEKTNHKSKLSMSFFICMIYHLSIRIHKKKIRTINILLRLLIIPAFHKFLRNANIHKNNISQICIL